MWEPRRAQFARLHHRVLDLDVYLSRYPPSIPPSIPPSLLLSLAPPSVGCTTFLRRSVGGSPLLSKQCVVDTAVTADDM